MIATKEHAAALTLPEMAVPDADRAISIVNRWLQTETGTAIHVSHATFNVATYCWHLPVLLAYPDTGPVGVIGDVYLQAATGQFVGLPDAEDLQRRAIALAEKCGLVETDEDE